jgi:cobalt/nickel transport system permease protein
LHHAVVESWTQRRSWLHARDARAKDAVLLAFLIAVATTARMSPRAAAGYGLCVAAAILASGLPPVSLLLRACVVLPFSAVFALFAVLAGDPNRAVSLVLKSYLSAAAVLVVVATTPLPALLRSMESFGVPRFFALVVQFLYRYLFVVSEQAQHMRAAAASRGGRGFTFRSAASALAVLFARSHARAEGIHRAMLARGFFGRTVALAQPRAALADGLFLAAGLAAMAALRLWNH